MPLSSTLVSLRALPAYILAYVAPPTRVTIWKQAITDPWPKGKRPPTGARATRAALHYIYGMRTAVGGLLLSLIYTRIGAGPCILPFRHHRFSSMMRPGVSRASASPRQENQQAVQPVGLNVLGVYSVRCASTGNSEWRCK